MSAEAEAYQEGRILLLNKPREWSSFDVVKKVKTKLFHKYKLKKIKVGHAGTLDPLADGLMIVCTGRATKKLNDFQGFTKEYVATFGLGKTTPCYDLEKDFDGEFPIDHITKELVENTLNDFLGEQEQIPPVFSAKKLNGKRAYEMARENIEVKMKPSIIKINEIELLSYDLPFVKVRINCSKGTYIRSIARDLGTRLNSGAYLAALTRTMVGDYNLKDSVDVVSFEEDEATV